jgi:hypothetical protein
MENKTENHLKVLVGVHKAQNRNARIEITRQTKQASLQKAAGLRPV